MSDVTQILTAINKGDPNAAEELLPLVYDELRKLAAARMAQEKPGQTLQATGLVHEAFLRLVGAETATSWDSRGHFFAAAAEAMRRILVDRNREKSAQKRGGHFLRIELTEDIGSSEQGPHRDDLELLDFALSELERHDPVKAKLVKLRYFAGLTGAQAASALGIGESTADKYWAYSKVWLRSAMKRLEAGEP